MPFGPKLISFPPHIRTGHPLARGLQLHIPFWEGAGNSVHDVTGHLRGLAVGSAMGGWGDPAHIGTALRGGTEYSANNLIDLGTTLDPSGWSGVSCFALLRIKQDVANRYPGILMNVPAGGHFGCWALQLTYDLASGFRGFGWRAGNAATLSHVLADTFTNLEIAMIGGTWDKANLRTYYNGRLHGGPTAQAVGFGANNNAYLNYYLRTQYRSSACTYYGVWIWDHALSDAEVAQHYDDPCGLITPRTRTFAFFGAAATILTPAPVAVAAAVPAAGIVLRLTPSPVTAPAAVPAAKIILKLAPSPVAAPAAVPAAKVILKLTPSPVAAPAAVPAVTLVVGFKLTPSPVVAVAAVPAPTIVQPGGYNWYYGVGGPDSIDYTTIIAHASPGVTTVDITGLGLAEDTDYWFACRAISDAGVEEENTDRIVRVRISGGALVGPPPNKPAWAAAQAAAGGKVTIRAFYSDRGELAAAVGLQVAPVTAGVPDWGNLLTTIAVGGTGHYIETPSDVFADGEPLRFAVRAVTAAGAVSGHVLTNAVTADSAAPPAVALLTGAQL